MTGIRKFPPLIYVIAKIVDNWGWVVLLFFSRKPLAFVENQCVLGGFPLLLLGFWNRGNEFCTTPSLNNLLCRLSLAIKLPMTLRVAVRRVQNGAFKKVVIHGLVSKALARCDRHQMKYMKVQSDYH